MRIFLTFILFLTISISYSIIVPAFETPDEPYHYAFARHVAQGNGLPVQTVESEDAPWSHEGSQAPLYYLLTGALTSVINQDNFDILYNETDGANIGDPLYAGKKNYVLYSSVSWPWSPPQHILETVDHGAISTGIQTIIQTSQLVGAQLALRMGRWFSILLACLTLWFTYLTAKKVFPDDDAKSPYLPLLSILLLVSIPQFAFISASFSNDNAVILASTITIYWLIHLLTQSQKKPITLWEWSILGVCLGVAALSKLQGLGLIAIAGIVYLRILWREDCRKRISSQANLQLNTFIPKLLVAGVAIALPVLLIAGWWYWRNYTLYGDWLGVNYLLDINGQREDALTWQSAWGEFRGLRYSFWGLFGWFNILLPQWVYNILDWVTILGGIGLGISVIRYSKARLENPVSDSHNMIKIEAIAALALWFLILFALLVYWATGATSSQGRLLFPALSSICILLTYGLVALVQSATSWLARFTQEPLETSAISTILFSTIPTLLIGCSVYTLGFLLHQNYRQPEPILWPPEPEQLRQLKIVNLTYGQADQITIYGVHVPRKRYYIGQKVPVQVYLGAEQPLAQDYQLFIQFLDETGYELSNLTSHTGWGRNPTMLWIPETVYEDTYEVLIEAIANPDRDEALPDTPPQPVQARVYIGFVDPDTLDEENLPRNAYREDGVQVIPFVDSITILPAIWPPRESLVHEDAKQIGTQFGRVIELAAVKYPVRFPEQPDTPFRVTLWWHAIGIPAGDYTAYVHVYNRDGEQVAGFDQPPAGERFPTQYWRAEDQLQSDFQIDFVEKLPPGVYDLWVGLYESDSQGDVRLPVTDDAGQFTKDLQVNIGQVEIVEISAE
ncbi:MAG: glycosyltransferase family 39 protein [Chloroflexota bacterium]